MERDLEQPKSYKTIVISDVHLGSKWSKAKEATAFIKENSCETLILCGDIIDGWAIMRGRNIRWKKRHTDFIKTLLDISHTTRIIYIRGNHDDFLDRIVPMNFLNMEIVKDHIHESKGKKYFVLHGDLFDSVSSNMKWLAKLGDMGYSLLLMFNRYYNQRRIRKGLPYRSIASIIKRKVKKSLSLIDKFETHISTLARTKICDGVICGHIHHPEIKMIDGIHYLNSGDWVESLSALTEDYDGNWSIHLDEVDRQSLSFNNLEKD
ncbi:MAG: UDP-2,3-diacylglucosamine diphosphatase [Rikenellaceae bacterium]